MQIPGWNWSPPRARRAHELTLQFALEKSIDAAATDVQTAITQATGSLPVDLPSPPTFSKTNPNDQPILYIALTSDSVTRGQLYDYGKHPGRPADQHPAGRQPVQVFGTKAAVRIKADPSAMAARGITWTTWPPRSATAPATRAPASSTAPTGTVLLQPQGQLETAAGYDNLIVGTRNGAPVYLRDVATGEDSVQDERINMRFWVRGYARAHRRRWWWPSSARPGANAVEVARRSGTAAADRAELARVGTRHADLRPLRDHRQQRRGRAGDALSSPSSWW